MSHGQADRQVRNALGVVGAEKRKARQSTARANGALLPDESLLRVRDDRRPKDGVPAQRLLCVAFGRPTRLLGAARPRSRHPVCQVLAAGSRCLPSEVGSDRSAAPREQTGQGGA